MGSSMERYLSSILNEITDAKEAAESLELQAECIPLLLKRIADTLDAINLDLENELKEAIEANTQKLDDVYGVLVEILEQSHNPLRPLPPLPVGRGNNGGDDELIQKPRQKRKPSLGKLDRDGFKKW